MNIKECYACIGANWQEVYERFGCNEAIVKKFAIKFLEDPSFHDMKKAVAEGDTDRAFRAAHTLKGISSNLEFPALQEKSSKLVDLIRGDQLENVLPTADTIKAEYQKIISKIQELE